ncbi:hypothetical protein ACVWZ3_000513 [Bradyrhizobium sp. i1.3.6]
MPPRRGGVDVSRCIEPIVWPSSGPKADSHDCAARLLLWIQQQIRYFGYDHNRNLAFPSLRKPIMRSPSLQLRNELPLNLVQVLQTIGTEKERRITNKFG